MTAQGSHRCKEGSWWGIVGPSKWSQTGGGGVKVDGLCLGQQTHCRPGGSKLMGGCAVMVLAKPGGVKVDGGRGSDSVGEGHRGSKLMGLGAWLQLPKPAGGQSGWVLRWPLRVATGQGVTADGAICCLGVGKASGGGGGGSMLQEQGAPIQPAKPLEGVKVGGTVCRRDASQGSWGVKVDGVRCSGACGEPTGGQS